MTILSDMPDPRLRLGHYQVRNSRTISCPFMPSMRAMVLTECAPIESKPLKLQEIDRHKISRPNEILLKIEACGVCHSQLHGIEGDWKDIGIPPSLPTVPGHEIVGRVAEIGESVTRFKVGDKAGVSPLLESCLDCSYCNEGKEYLCESMMVLGESMRGGYAEYVTVTEDFATPVPSDMPSEYAAPLFCAGITAYKAVAACEPFKGARVGIFGIGGVGHMAVQFARLCDCDVTAVSRNPAHLDVAKKLGASTGVKYSGLDSTVAEISKLGLLDSAIVFAPSDEVTDVAIKSIKKGGTVVIATVGKIPNFLAFEEKTIRGTLIGSRADMAEVIRLAHTENLEVVSETFGLEEANEALLMLKNSKVEARAVLVP